MPVKAKKTGVVEVVTKSRLNLFTATFMARSRWKPVFFNLLLVFFFVVACEEHDACEQECEEHYAADISENAAEVDC